MSTHSKQESVRLTIDFPVDQHTYIKMLAAAEGVTLKQFVTECLPSPDNQNVKHKKIPKRKFNKLLKEFLIENAPMLERLANK